jgi:hypothetical protein
MGTMKKFKITMALTLVLSGLMLIVNGCKKDTEDPIVETAVTPSGSVTVFTNQTGDANESANGLQVQVLSENNTVDFYGNFNDLSDPDVLNSIRVNQLNSDTVVNFIMDELTGNFERAVFELNGEKLNIVVDFEFPAGDTTMILSHYNYNWDTGESELYYAGEYSLSGGVVGETAVFARGQQGAAGTDDWITAGVGVGVGVGIAEIALATGVIAGTGLVGTAAGAVAVAVAGVSSTVILAAVVVGVALATISGANASELVPQNGPIPNGTPPGNAPNGQLPDPLPENPCITNRVFVIVGADDDGTLTAIATGGTGDYTYSWSNGTTVTTSVTFHTLSPETEGTYSVLVNDENGCVATGSATSYTEDVEELTTVEKLVQWGPWRAQDAEQENSDEELVPGFSTITFSGVNCDCLSVANYEYTNIETDQYEVITSYGFCIDQGSADMSFLFDESPCETPPEGVLSVSSLTQQGVVLNAEGGEVLTCTPF